MVHAELLECLQNYGQPRKAAETEDAVGVNDWRQLVQRWWETESESVEEREIEDSLGNLVRQITEWSNLFEMYEVFARQGGFGCLVPCQQVQDRLIELLPSLIPNVSFDELERMHDKLLYYDALCYLCSKVVGRMKTLLNDVTADNCPDWFLHLLRRNSTSHPVLVDIQQKVRALKAELMERQETMG